MQGFLAVAAMVTLGMSACGCSGTGYGAGSNANQTSPTAPSGSDVVTVNVVAINGAQSFSPNPATLKSGQRMVWHNIDTVTHRVVLNDGSMDTAGIAPRE